MSAAGYATYPQTKEVLLSPKRSGCFELEQCSMGTVNGEVKFFNHPEVGPIRLELRFYYEIDEGEDDPHVARVEWHCADNDRWQVIDCPYLENATDDLLNEPEVKRTFEAWAQEHSEIVYPRFRPWVR